CHNHLSRRWRSTSPHPGPFRWQIQLLLPSAGELLLQRRQFCKRRVRIDRTVAIARVGAGGILPKRRPALALVATALVPAAMFAIAVTAVAVALALVTGLEFIAAAVIAALAVAPLALEALAARTMVLARLLWDGRAVGRGRNGWRRRIAAVLAEILMPAAAAVLLALVALAGFAGRRLRTAMVAVMALTMALGTRPPLIRTAAGPPDFDQFRFGGRSFDRSGFGTGG